MRLRALKEVLERNIDYLKVEGIDQGNRKMEIKDFSSLHRALTEISDFEFVEDEMVKIENMDSVYNDKSERVIVDNNEFNQFKAYIDIISMKIRTVITAIEEALPEQNVNSVSIKLPNYKELAEVSDFIKEIDSILKHTMVEQFQGPIKLQNFDTGSNWIEIVMENKEAIMFLGSVINSSMMLLKNFLIQSRQTRQMVTQLELDGEAKEKVLHALDQTVKAQGRFYAKTLMDDYEIKENDNEYHTHLTHSIITFADYVSKGTEVHTALNAPSETQEAFPDTTAIPTLIGGAIKLLTDSEDDTEQESEQEPEDDSNQ